MTFNESRTSSAGSWFLNPNAKDFVCPPPLYSQALEAFHRALSNYATTPLHKLPESLSESLNLSSIHIKDESMRFGLPSFKILGASWAVYCAICKRLDISIDESRVDLAKDSRTESILPISLTDLSAAAQKMGIRLVLCTDGNWGRAVAYIGALLGAEVTVYVPEYVDAPTRDLIASEGAEVHVYHGDYDGAIGVAMRDAAGDHNTLSQAQNGRNLLVMDTSWEGYEEIPAWVTQGYETMLVEVDQCLACSGCGGSEEPIKSQPDLVIVSVGVGSWAHAVVQHYKSLPRDSRPLIVTVESSNAASLLTSLQNDRITPIATSPTIMAGMNCGTTSYIAWPFLQQGVDLALTVNDRESHEAVIELRNECGIESGPCGAAPFAALKKILAKNLLAHEGFGRDSASRDGKTIVLFSTEGRRIYATPS